MTRPSRRGFDHQAQRARHDRRRAERAQDAARQVAEEGLRADYGLDSPFTGDTELDDLLAGLGVGVPSSGTASYSTGGVVLPQRVRDNRWRDGEDAMGEFLAEFYGLTGVTVDLTGGAAGRRVHFDEVDNVLQVNLDALDVPNPTLKHRGSGRAITVDDTRPYGAFTDPRVQVPGARIFGMVHLELAGHRYDSWAARIAVDADAEVLADAATATACDRVRGQVLLARSSVWMNVILQAGYIPWITDPAAVPTGSARERLEWLVARIILPQAAGMLPEDAALVARQEVTRHIGTEVLNRVVDLFLQIAYTINPTAAEMLLTGRRLRELWDGVDEQLRTAGIAASDVETEEAAKCAADALVMPVKQRLQVVGRRWRPREWPKTAEQDADRFGEWDHPVLNTTTGAGARELINDEQWGSLVGNLEADLEDVTESERRMVNRIVAELSHARARKFGVGTSPSATPGGRMDTQQLIQMQAQIAAGRRPTATPWTTRHLHQKAKPNINAALVFDASISMGPWRDAAGPLAWSLINAVDQIGGTAAAWSFSGAVAPIARSAANYADRVPHLNGRGGKSTKCAEALQEACKDAGFIDAADTDGAKVAMIITDGEPLDQEAPAIQRQVAALVHQDVKVYWISVGVLGSGMRAPVGATQIILSDPGSFADDVIRTIVNELRSCGAVEPL